MSDATLYPEAGKLLRDWHLYRHGGGLEPSPEGMRQLTDAEKAVNDIWRWDEDLATWVCDSHPQGIEP